MEVRASELNNEASYYPRKKGTATLSNSNADSSHIVTKRTVVKSQRSCISLNLDEWTILFPYDKKSV